MTNNIVDKVISTDDLKIIAEIAEKYDMTVVEFGRFIGKGKNEKGVRVHVRFSEDELSIIDKEASKVKLSRSKYCREAYNWFIDSGIYKNVNVKDLREDKSDRSIRVNVMFPDAEEYKKMHKLAKGFSIPFSTLIRYCALRYSNVR